MVRPIAVLLVVALTLAGCLDGPGDEPEGGGDDGDAARVIPAPWWEVGEWWEMRVTRSEMADETYLLAHFENDSATHHFWLGAEDRDQALEHALFDTNPFLGRMHWEILAPHEEGTHAHMYAFPLADGKRWQGHLLGIDWSFEGAFEDDRYWIGAESSTGDRLRFDYDVEARWFTRLTRTDASGATTLDARITDHGFDATGTYWFLRGRDFYRGPQATDGTHSEPFQVDEDVDRLAVHFDVTTTGATRIDILKPNGETAKQITLTGGGAHKDTEEIPGPITRGQWTARYVQSGSTTGDVFAIGLLEYRGDL